MKQETLARLQANDIKESKLEFIPVDNALNISLYGVISEEGPNSSTAFMDLLADHEDKMEINLSINSIGGEIKEGFAIYEMLRNSPATVHIKVDGIAASMASMICMAGDKVTMGPSSLMMIHNPICSMTGNAKELREQAERLDAQATAARKAYLLKSGDRLSEDRLIELMDAETFLNANECMEIGFCDEISGFDPVRMTAEIAALKADKEKLESEIERLKSELIQNDEDKPSDETGWFF